jgi:phage terminase small subunit
VNSYPPGKLFLGRNLTERGLPFMNARQKKFCDEYLIDCNATQAAIRAGYSPKTAKVTAAKLLTNANLKTYIEQQLERIHNEKTADAQEVLEYLTSVMRGEHTEEIPILCGDGCQELTQKEVGAKERLKAAELIGKRYGMFTDKVGVEGAVPVIITGDDQLED